VHCAQGLDSDRSMVIGHCAGSLGRCPIRTGRHTPKEEDRLMSIAKMSKLLHGAGIHALLARARPQPEIDDTR
jgi:hypothetical protein